MKKPTAIVYVDGFNLYKGQLENRPANKWLNLVSLFDDVLSDYSVVTVHYFTARIKGRMNPDDPRAPDRQDAYIRALRSLKRMEVHDDSLFTVHHGMAREWVDGKERPPLTRHHVYKVQEKGSDVKLATRLLMDALDGLADTYVVVSSDFVFATVICREKSIARPYPDGKTTDSPSGRMERARPRRSGALSLIQRNRGCDAHVSRHTRRCGGSWLPRAFTRVRQLPVALPARPARRGTARTPEP